VDVWRKISRDEAKVSPGVAADADSQRVMRVFKLGLQQQGSPAANWPKVEPLHEVA